MNTAADMIRQEISKSGAISFARFMSLALYHPELGYYEREANHIGRNGDFITSVSVGSFFGELLAFRFAEWLSDLEGKTLNAKTPGNDSALTPGNTAPRPSSGRGLQIVEAGAHDGRLASDILSWLQNYRPSLWESLEYWILEPSIRRRKWQERALAPFEPRVRWFSSWESILPARIHGIIFANELLDSFPTHRVGWDAAMRRWFEWGVTWNGEQFAWARMTGEFERKSVEKILGAHFEFADELLAQLPDGFSTERCVAAEEWWRQAANTLERGKLLTIDYGLREEQFFVPERGEGTLRAYHKHRLNSDLLSRVGDQDLTSQVNFSAIKRAGEESGLVSEGWITQSKFLTEIFENANRENSTLISLTPERIRQFQTLIHPEHLGRAFQVLIQTRPPETAAGP